MLGQDRVGRQPVPRLVAPLTDQLLDSRCKPLVKRSGHVRQLDLLNGGGAQWYSQYNMRNCTTSQKMPLWPSIKWPDRPSRKHGRAIRSEEHTSELQSLMRISYAVFCLKKKKKKSLKHIPIPQTNKIQQ